MQSIYYLTLHKYVGTLLCVGHCPYAVEYENRSQGLSTSAEHYCRHQRVGINNNPCHPLNFEIAREASFRSASFSWERHAAHNNVNS